MQRALRGVCMFGRAGRLYGMGARHGHCVLCNRVRCAQGAVRSRTVLNARCRVWRCSGCGDAGAGPGSRCRIGQTFQRQGALFAQFFPGQGLCLVITCFRLVALDYQAQPVIFMKNLIQRGPLERRRPDPAPANRRIRCGSCLVLAARPAPVHALARQPHHIRQLLLRDAQHPHHAGDGHRVDKVGRGCVPPSAPGSLRRSISCCDELARRSLSCSITNRLNPASARSASETCRWAGPPPGSCATPGCCKAVHLALEHRTLAEPTARCHAGERDHRPRESSLLIFSRPSTRPNQ